MKRIVQIIQNKYYTYKPGEFLPIYTDGQLSNKKSFHLYKAKKAITPVFGKFLDTI